MRGAIISEAHFQDIIFEKDVYFSDALFGALVGEDTETNGENEAHPLSTVVRFVTFEGQADFKRTAFETNTGFENVTFMHGADFTDAHFMKKNEGPEAKFSLSYLQFTKLRLSWEQLPVIESWVSGSQARILSFSDKKDKQSNKTEPEPNEVKKLGPLSSVLNNLETNFRSNKQLYDANQAYFHRKKAELREDQETNDHWLTKQKEAEWYLWGIICGYGTKIWWIAGWSFFSICCLLQSIASKGS